MSSATELQRFMTVRQTAANRLPFSFRPGDYNPVPGNGILDLKKVYNIVFAANWGEHKGVVATMSLCTATKLLLPADRRRSRHWNRDRLRGTHQLQHQNRCTQEMELVWSDEFDGDEIILDNWRFDQGGWGWGNGESQFPPTVRRTPESLTACLSSRHVEEYLGRITPPRV